MSQSKHHIIANSIVCLHLLFVVVFVGGAIFSFFKPWYAPYHIVFVLATVVYHLVKGGCPLTAWEVKHRRLHNPDAVYKNESFYAHYFFYKFCGIDVTTKQVKLFLLVTKVVPGLIPILVVLQLV